MLKSSLYGVAILTTHALSLSFLSMCSNIFWCTYTRSLSIFSLYVRIHILVGIHTLALNLFLLTCSSVFWYIYNTLQHNLLARLESLQHASTQSLLTLLESLQHTATQSLGTTRVSATRFNAESLDTTGVFATRCNTVFWHD